jgi:crossover junction endodeoxyribonuclease RuvC
MMDRIIFGLDPALRCCGYGIVAQEAGRLRCVAFGVIKNSPTLKPSSCLVEIRQRVTQLIVEFQPTCAAVEGVIYLQNYKTAVQLGAARGAALVALAEAGLPIYEYAPRRVKSAATGRGGAQKGQVSFMMRALLGLTENPPDDAGDALAVAVTHAQNQGILSAPKEI